MPAYHVERSIRIDAAQSKVRPAIEDFSKWPQWSPWLCMEPTATVNVHGTPGQSNHGYDWEGELVGAGSMQITSVEKETQQMDLEFLRPFKSRAGVTMEIKPVGERQTEVTWQMDGKMPFFLFFMISTMKSMIGMDFARGLKMLKEYVENGSVNSKTEVSGIVDLPEMSYLGVEVDCSLDEIGESMQENLPKAHRLATENGLEITGPPGAVYSRFDMKNQECAYAAFVPVKSCGEISGAISGTIPACKAAKITHKGSYEHLGNAWSTAMAHQRYKKLKPLKKVHPFEVYCNDPCNTPEEELITEIYLPIRG